MANPVEASTILLDGLQSGHRLGGPRESNHWTSAYRSGIPASLTGTVDRVEVRHEKHAGLDDVHLVTISGSAIHLDADMASLLERGDEIQKGWGSVRLTTPRGTSTIGPSKDFLRMLLAMPLLVGLALWLLGYVRRATSG